MKITSIRVEHILGLSYANLEITKPVVMVAGDNGAGKTSLVEAIAMAFDGAGRRGVALKKNYSQLVRGSQKKGSVAVELESGACVLELPSGKHKTFDISENPFLPFLLDASRLAGLDDKKRRPLLNQLSGVRTTGKDVAERLRKRGVSERLIGEIGPMIAGGFAVAHDSAKEAISRQRGVWEGITGEKYGAQKAVDWLAPVPAMPTEEQQAAIASQLAEAKAELQGLTERRVQLQNDKRTAEQLATQREKLQATVELLERRKAKLATDKADADQAAARLADAQARAGDASATRYICPCCETSLVMVGGKLVQAGSSDPEAVAALPDLANAARVTAQAAANSLRDVEEAMRAADALTAMPAPAAVAEGELERIAEQITQVGQDVGLLEGTVRATEADKQAFVNAAELTARANAAHQLSTEWELAAAALAPDGIPSDLTREAIGPVNKLLASLAGMANWPAVQFSDDLQVVRGDRPYSLLSESEKWRCDCLLSLAVANLSGLRFCVLDRFDVLQPSARGELLDLLAFAAEDGLVDTVIAAGTLKAPIPEDELTQSFWIATAEVQPANSLAAAA